MQLFRALLLLTLPLLTLSPAGAADSESAALAQLQSHLAAIQSLTGDFQQQLFADDGKQLEQSSGLFKLLKPGYFSWHITAPDEQLLVAAQGSLWHYDVELETATRRDIPQENSSSPLSILGGNAEQLGLWYQVDALAAQRWRLTPRSDQAEFSAIEISFDGERPLSMTIDDALQRRTEIRFSAVQLAVPLSPADFDFEPPPGVDVYDAVQ